MAMTSTKNSGGLSKAEDLSWVTDALSFWKLQLKKHPKSAEIQSQIRQFENWKKSLENPISYEGKPIVKEDSELGQLFKLWEKK